MWAANIETTRSAISLDLNETSKTELSIKDNAGFNSGKLLDNTSYYNFDCMGNNAKGWFVVNNLKEQRYTLNFEASTNFNESDKTVKIKVEIYDSEYLNATIPSETTAALTKEFVITKNSINWQTYDNICSLETPVLTIGKKTIVLTFNTTNGGYTANVRKVEMIPFKEYATSNEHTKFTIKENDKSDFCLHYAGIDNKKTDKTHLKANTKDGSTYWNIDNMTNNQQAWFVVENLKEQFYKLSFKAAANPGEDKGKSSIKIDIINNNCIESGAPSYTETDVVYTKTFEDIKTGNWQVYELHDLVTRGKLTTGNKTIVFNFLNSANSNTVNVRDISIEPTTEPTVKLFSCDLDGKTSVPATTDEVKRDIIINSEKELAGSIVAATLNDKPITGTISGSTITFSNVALSGATVYTFTIPELSVTTTEGDKNAEYKFKFSTMPSTKLTPAPDENAEVVIYTVNAPTVTEGVSDFPTIQDAINAAKERVETSTDNNGNEVKSYFYKRAIIFIPNGTYDENIYTAGKGTGNTDTKFISLVGESQNTILTSSVFRSTDKSSTDYRNPEACVALYVNNERFYAENLTIRNTCGTLGEALYTRGDAHIFKNCQILGYQDTYKANGAARGYFTGCKFVGATDFIYDGGLEWFEKCEIHSLKRTEGNSWITAPGDSKTWLNKIGYPSLSRETFYAGLFFNDCKLTAENETAANTYYLGRAWKENSGVVFMNCELGNHIKAEGWDAWSKDTQKLSYMEYKHKKNRAKSSVAWVTEPSDAEVEAYFNPDFLFKLPTTMVGDGLANPVRFEYNTILKSVPAPSDFKVEYNGDNVKVSWAYKGAVGFILFENGKFNRILLNAEFECPETNDNVYSIKAISKYGVTSEAVRLPVSGNRIFRYKMEESTSPDYNIIVDSEGDVKTLEWTKNAVAKTGVNNYMKSGTTAMLLTGNFKAGDKITLEVYNYDIENGTDNKLKLLEEHNGIVVYDVIIPNNDTDTSLAEDDRSQSAPGKGNTATFRYYVISDCDKIRIKRYNPNGSGLFINRILIERTKPYKIKTVADREYMEIEMNALQMSLGNGEYSLPYIKGEIYDTEGNFIGMFKGNPTLTISPTDKAMFKEYYKETGKETSKETSKETNVVPNEPNANKRTIIGKGYGEAAITATFNAPSDDYEVVPCSVTVNVVKSCINEIKIYGAETDNPTTITHATTNALTLSRLGNKFEINDNLECNLFFEGYTLDVKLINPYDDGTKVFYRFHIHDKADPTVNYDESSGTIEKDGTPVEFKGLSNSFVIYVEHRTASGEVLVTKTYEFIHIDDKVYYAARTGNKNSNFTLLVKENGDVEYNDAGNITNTSELSVRGLKMTYGGTYNGKFGTYTKGGKKYETWDYTSYNNNNQANKFVGSDGVLTFGGYSLASWEIPLTEDSNKRYDHRFSMKGINWSSQTYSNGQGQLVRATNSTGTFALPVIGGHLKFEPEQNGTIILHIFQSGNAYDIGIESARVKGVENRPFYFLDEAGRSLQLKSYRTTSFINFDEYNERIAYRYNNNLTDDEEHLRRACNAYMLKKGYALPSKTQPTIKGWSFDGNNDPHYLTYTNEEDKLVKELVGDGLVESTYLGRKMPQEVIVLHSATNEEPLKYTYKDPDTGKEREITVDRRSTHPNIATRPEFSGLLPKYIRERNGGEYPTDLVYFIGNSAGGSFSGNDMKDGTGYMLITDGFIKYAFDVKAGKSYFPFVMGAKFGMCGYEFIPNQTVGEAPDVTPEVPGDDDPNSAFTCNYLTASTSYNNNKGNKEIILSGAANANNLTVLAGVTNGEQYDVTLKDRTFTEHQWTSIVLPFSVSETKLKKLLGDDTKVLHFDYIKTTTNEDKTTTYTLMLRKHYYDMIVAGTPVFIYPGKTVSGPIKFNNVTIECTSDADLDKVSNYIKQDSYMKSSFNSDKIGYMGIFLSTGNKFYQNRTEGNEIALNPLRGWIKTNMNTGGRAKMSNYLGEEFDFEDEALGIDFIEVDDGKSHQTFSNDNIYNINGQKVGSSFTDINTLPNGIYIVNGKKFTVNNK